MNQSLAIVSKKNNMYYQTSKSCVVALKWFTIPIVLYIKLQFKTPLQELLIDTIPFLSMHTFGHDIV